MKAPVIRVQSVVVRRDGTIEIRVQPQDVERTAAAATKTKITFDFDGATVRAERTTA